MCKEIIVNGALCSTHGELKVAIDGDPIYEPGISEGEDGDCLCGIDVEATARKNGFDIVESNAWETIMVKPPEPAAQK